MKNALRELPSDLIVASNFNTGAVKWGMSEVNSKGKTILEMIARLGQVVINKGKLKRSYLEVQVKKVLSRAMIFH